MSDDERLAAFLDIVSKMPPTWTCIRCGEEHENSPDGEMPEAIQTRLVKVGDRMQRVVIGDLCRQCAQGESG